MAAGHSETIEMQKEDDIIYENVETKTTAQEKDPQKTLQPDFRLYKLVGAGVGLLCAAQALLNIGLRLSLYQSIMVERDNNLTEENIQLQFSLEQLQIRLINLTHQKELLETSFKQLEVKCKKNLTEDALKKTSCESHGFTFGGGLCYYISTETKTWEESRQYCRHKQSDLMVIKSKEKQDFVQSLRRGKCGRARAWLGLTDRDEEGNWNWVDGTQLTTPTYWYNPVEFNKEDKHCAVFSLRGWSIYPCYYKEYWVCERVM